MEHIVYVKTENDYITMVNSSEFLTDITDWTEIDRGHGDRYHHAQNNYFGDPIITDGGACRYKLVDGVPMECTAEEIKEQEKTNQTEPVPTADEVLNTLLGVIE